jgi:hypothetical protein
MNSVSHCGRWVQGCRLKTDFRGGLNGTHPFYERPDSKARPQREHQSGRDARVWNATVKPYFRSLEHSALFRLKASKNLRRSYCPTDRHLLCQQSLTRQRIRRP